jgi:hypothetical protein
MIIFPVASSSLPAETESLNEDRPSDDVGAERTLQDLKKTEILSRILIFLK